MLLGALATIVNTSGACSSESDNGDAREAASSDSRVKMIVRDSGPNAPATTSSNNSSSTGHVSTTSGKRYPHPRAYMDRWTDYILLQSLYEWYLIQLWRYMSHSDDGISQSLYYAVVTPCCVQLCPIYLFTQLVMKCKVKSGNNTRRWWAVFLDIKGHWCFSLRLSHKQCD